MEKKTLKQALKYGNQYWPIKGWHLIRLEEEPNCPWGLQISIFFPRVTHYQCI